MSLGKRDPVGRGATPLDGAQVDYQWKSDRTVNVTMAKSSGAWAGPWAVVFVAPVDSPPSIRSKTNIHISGGLLPFWSDTKALHAGEKTSVTFGVAAGDGSTVSPAEILGTASLTSELITAEGRSIATTASQDKRAIGTPVALDLSRAVPGQASLRLTLAVTTADARLPDGRPVPGTVLTPRVVDVPLTVAAPEGYPTVGSSIDFGRHEGAGRWDQKVPVSGSGCVWIDAPEKAVLRGVPDGVGAVTVSSSAVSRDTCVKVSPGATALLPVSVSTQQSTNGTLNGSVTVMLAPDGAGEPVAQRVDFTAQLTNPLNQPLFVGALIVTLVVGIGLPFLFLYLAKWWTAKIPGDPLVFDEIAISVVDGMVLRDGAPFTLQEQDLVTPVTGLGRGSRRVTVGSLELRTHSGLTPFGAGYVLVGKSSLLSGSSATPSSVKSPPRARLGLAIHNSWIVVVDPAGPADGARLVLLVGGLTSQDQREKLVEDMCNRAPGVIADLRSTATGLATDAGPESTPFGAESGARPGTDPFGPAGFSDASPFGVAPTQSASPGPGPSLGSSAQGSDGSAASGGFADAPDPFGSSDPFDPR
ncbi:hypothetical protein [Williamsia sp. M5A3_1d]